MKAVIFDAFGTLVRIGDKRNPIRRHAEKSGFSGVELGEYVMTRELCPESLRDLLKLEGTRYETFLVDLHAELDSISPYPETEAVLNWLDTRNIPWVVVSNLASPYCEPLLTQLQVSRDNVIMSCEVGTMKPHPEIFQMALSRLGVGARHTMVVGDSHHDDVMGATQCGMTPFHLRRPAMTLGDILPHLSGDG